MPALFKNWPFHGPVEGHTVRPSYVTAASPSLLEQKMTLLTHREVSAHVLQHESFGACLSSIRGRLTLTYVRPNGVAWRMGLNAGDQITMYNGEKCNSPQGLLDNVRTTKGEITLTVMDAAVVRVKLVLGEKDAHDNSGGGLRLSPVPQRQRSNSTPDAKVDFSGALPHGAEGAAQTAAACECTSQQQQQQQQTQKGSALQVPSPTAVKSKNTCGLIKRVVSYTDFHSLAATISDHMEFQIKTDTRTPAPQPEGSQLHGLTLKDGKICDVLDSSPAHNAAMESMKGDYGVVAVGSTQVAGVMSDREIESLIAKQLRSKHEVVIVCARSQLTDEVANAAAEMKRVFGE